MTRAGEIERHAPGGGLCGSFCWFCGFAWEGHPTQIRENPDPLPVVP